MCETNTCVCRYFLFALKPYTGIYSFRQAKQNSKTKHLCSALKLYPNIFFYFIHTCTLFRKAIPLHIHYILFRLFAQLQSAPPGTALSYICPNILTCSSYSFFIASPNKPIKNPTTPAKANKILYINSSFHSGHKPFLYLQYSISPVPFLVLCLRYSKKINVFLQPDKKRTVYAAHIHCSKPYSLCFISGILVQAKYNFSIFPFNSFFSLFSQVRKTHNFKVSSNPHAS